MTKPSKSESRYPVGQWHDLSNGNQTPMMDQTRLESHRLLLSSDKTNRHRSQGSFSGERRTKKKKQTRDLGEKWKTDGDSSARKKTNGSSVRKNTALLKGRRPPSWSANPSVFQLFILLNHLFFLKGGRHQIGFHFSGI